MNKVFGTITKINYYDETNNFGIVRIQLDYKNPNLAEFKTVLFSNNLTVLSNFDRKPLLDEEYHFTGELVVTSYGWQFKAQTFSRSLVQSEEGIITYLSSDYFPGVGRTTAIRVFAALGETSLSDIINDRSLLDRVNISKKQKDTIYEVLSENYENEQQLIKLLNLGISMRLALKIIKVIPSNAEQLIKQDPYQLIDLVEGIGFMRADAIASKLGIAKDAPLRLKALLIHVLNNYVNNNGHTFINAKDWYLEACNFIKQEEGLFTEDLFEELKSQFLKDRKIIQDENKDIYLFKIYFAEINLAAKIKTILTYEQIDYNEETIIQNLADVMNSYDIEYTTKQAEAIRTALKEPISIITGGPGTGKSTIIKGLIDTYVSLFNNDQVVREAVKLIAPTGRAAKRLREVTKHPATTIHKLLGFEGGNYFTVTPDTPIIAKMVIIDEFSMVDINLASLLFSCILPTTKIVIIGDSDQLPSVGPGNVLFDLIQTKEITVTKLDQIHRQAKTSSIISLAYNIKNKAIPEDILEFYDDRRFFQCNNEQIIAYIEFTVKNALEKNMNLINDIQVLVPLYKGEVGIEAINHTLQERFNPSPEEINTSGKRFRVNDKVIQLVNRQEKQVMNGDIGYILTIDYTNEKFSSLTVMFDFGAVIYNVDELEDLSLAYAISIHKAQGSEFPLVIMPFSMKYYMMLKRKLIYTGVTRAKKYLIMIGSLDAMRKGVVIEDDYRHTKLTLRLKEAFQNTTPDENIIEDLKPEDFM